MSKITKPSMEEMLEAGVHFGHKTSRANPRMKEFIYGAREGVSIIDLTIAEGELNKAIDFAYKLGQDGKVLLVVGTKKQARAVVEEVAKATETPYITNHWVGGLLTNFSEIHRNLSKLMGLKIEQEKGELVRFTKKEQLLISRKLEKFNRNLGGLTELTVEPDALFVLDVVADQTAVKEAIRMNLPIIGVCDTNANPQMIDYPIPANDDGIKSIRLIAEAIINAYAEGKKSAVATREEAAKIEEKAAVDKEVLDANLTEQVAIVEEELEKEIVEDSSVKV
jgi:small subunit ribosomal protein S2